MILSWQAKSLSFAVLRNSIYRGFALQIIWLCRLALQVLVHGLTFLLLLKVRVLNWRSWLTWTLFALISSLNEVLIVTAKRVPTHADSQLEALQLFKVKV